MNKQDMILVVAGVALVVLNAFVVLGVSIAVKKSRTKRRIIMPDETVKTETIVTDGKTYTKKISAVGVYQWILLFLTAVIAFGILATWLRLGSMMGPNQAYLAAMHGVYINESGKPEMRMLRVDNSGFLGVMPVQKGPAEPQKPSGSLSPVQIQPQPQSTVQVPTPPPADKP